MPSGALALSLRLPGSDVLGCRMLLQSVAELEAARGELSSQAALAAGEVSRLSIALQDAEHHKAGLARKLTV